MQSQQVTSYSMAHGRLINIGAFRAQYQNQNQKIDHAWVQDLPCEMLMNDFAGWEPEVLHLLQVNILSSCLWLVLMFSSVSKKQLDGLFIQLSPCVLLFSVG